MNRKSKTVDGYIAAAPEWARPMLIEMRRAIKAAAPESQESISYHVPYYSQGGRLAYLGAYKNHCSFHWVSSEDKKTFAKELASQKVVGSTLQVPRGQKVPTALIKRIIKSRVSNRKPASGFPSSIGRVAPRELAVNGIRTLAQAARHTEKELLAIHGVGPKAVRIIKDELSKKKLRLKE